MSDLAIKNTDGTILFNAKIVPASSRTSISGTLDRMLKVKVAAAPEKGKANQALIEFLAKKLNLKKKDIKIISGQTNPVKTIQISNISTETLLKNLDSLQ